MNNMKTGKPSDLLKTQLNLESWKQLLYWVNLKLNYKQSQTCVLVRPNQDLDIFEDQDDFTLTLKLQKVQLVKIIKSFTVSMQKFRIMLKSPNCPPQALLNYQYYVGIMDKIYQKAIREDASIFHKLAKLCLRSIQNLICLASKSCHIASTNLSSQSKERKGSDLTHEGSKGLTCPFPEDVTDMDTLSSQKLRSANSDEGSTAFKRFIPDGQNYLGFFPTRKLNTISEATNL